MQAGIIINRPPRDGQMAFVRSPDRHSIELLQKGEPLPAREPWNRCRIPGNGEDAVPLAAACQALYTSPASAPFV